MDIFNLKKYISEKKIYRKPLHESSMSDVDTIAQESTTFEEFKGKFLADYGDKFSSANEEKLEKWLTDVYEASKSEE